MEAEQMVSSFPASHGAALLLPWACPSPAEVTLRKQSLRSPVPAVTTARCRDAGIPQLAAAALFHMAAAQQPQGRIKSLSLPPAAGNARGVSGTLG